MSFRGWWKKLSYWKKGGLIGALFYSLYYLTLSTFLIFLDIHIPFSIKVFLSFPLIPVFYISLYNCGFEGSGSGLLCDNLITQTIFYFVLFLFLGFIIGVCISLLTNRWKK